MRALQVLRQRRVRAAQARHIPLQHLMRQERFCMGLLSQNRCLRYASKAPSVARARTACCGGFSSSAAGRHAGRHGARRCTQGRAWVRPMAWLVSHKCLRCQLGCIEGNQCAIHYLCSSHTASSMRSPAATTRGYVVEHACLAAAKRARASSTSCPAARRLNTTPCKCATSSWQSGQARSKCLTVPARLSNTSASCQCAPDVLVYAAKKAIAHAFLGKGL